MPRMQPNCTRTHEEYSEKKKNTKYAQAFNAHLCYQQHTKTQSVQNACGSKCLLKYARILDKKNTTKNTKNGTTKKIKIQNANITFTHDTNRTGENCTLVGRSACAYKDNQTCVSVDPLEKKLTPSSQSLLQK